MARAYYTYDERMELKELQSLMKRASANKLATDFSPAVNAKLNEQIFCDHTQSTAKMFALLAWKIGARARELLQVTWEDFRSLPDDPNGKYCIVLHNSRVSTTGTTRCIPLEDDLTNFLMERKTWIANSGDTTECSSDFICFSENLAELLEETRQILLNAGVEKDALRLMELTIKFMEDHVTDLEEFDIIYLLRRDFGLRMTNKGLTKEQVCKLLDVPKN